MNLWDPEAPIGVGNICPGLNVTLRVYPCGCSVIQYRDAWGKGVPRSRHALMHGARVVELCR